MKPKPKRKLTINDEIQHLLRFMEKATIGSEEYESAARSLKDLCEARSKEDASFPVSPNTLVLAGTSFFELLAVLNYEQLHVLATKAFGLVRRV